jgi:hypothetical protein
MHWLEIQNLKDEDFKRYTGVKKKTFTLMVETIKEYEQENKFRILSSRYRNRRKKFGLRVNLISGIYNFELGN